MDKKYLVFVLLLFCFLQPAFAGVVVSLDFPPTALYGGNTVESGLVVLNDSSAGANIALEAEFSNHSGDTNGFSVLLSETDFFLDSGQSKDIKVFFSAAENIAPEQYFVRVVATGEFGEAQALPSVQGEQGNGFYGLLKLFAEEEPEPELVVEPEEPEPSKPLPGPIEEEEQQGGFVVQLPKQVEEEGFGWLYEAVAFVFALFLLGLLAILLKKKKNKKGGKKI